MKNLILIASIISWKVTFQPFPVNHTTESTATDRQVIVRDVKELAVYKNNLKPGKFECIGRYTGESGLCEISDVVIESLKGRRKIKAGQ